MEPGFPDHAIVKDILVQRKIRKSKSDEAVDHKDNTPEKCDRCVARCLLMQRSHFYGAKGKEENENVRKTAYLFAHTVPTLFRRNKYCMIKSWIKEKGGSEMMKFDNAKYRTVLNLIKKNGRIQGESSTVRSKAS